MGVIKGDIRSLDYGFFYHRWSALHPELLSAVSAGAVPGPSARGGRLGSSSHARCLAALTPRHS